MKFDVITFGGAVIDVFVGTDLPEKGKFIAYPTGSKILIKNLKFDVGGGGTNTAVAFSRLGLKTGWVGKVGGDDAGKNILDLMSREGVKFLGKIEKNEISGFSVILDSRENNRTVLTHRGVNNAISISDIKIKKLKTKWVYYSSALEESFKTQVNLAPILKRKGIKIAFNPGSYTIENKNLRPLLKFVDILTLNKEEAEILTKKKKNLLEELHKFIDKKGIVVITDKNKKISCYDGNKKYFLIPNKVKVVERTGAGDAFASGFVAAHIVGKSIPESLKLGLKESESVIGHFGAKNNLLRMKLK